MTVIMMMIMIMVIFKKTIFYDDVCFRLKVAFINVVHVPVKALGNNKYMNV